MKIVFLIVLLLCSLFVMANDSVMVLPFKPAPGIDNNHTWLGRAVSYFLVCGLEENKIAAFRDSHTTALMETHAIRFPYLMTKATALQLARDLQPHTLVWGEILPAQENSGDIIIKCVIIPMNSYHQTHLPEIKGKVDDLYNLMEKLLGHVMAHIIENRKEKTIQAAQTNQSPGTIPRKTTRLPVFNLNHRNYELFIKSHLLTEPQEIIQLLEKAWNTDKKSDHLNFRLARAYFTLGKHNETIELLKQIPARDPKLPEPPTYAFKSRKLFLSALVNHHSGKTGAALEVFTALANQDQFPFESRHNMAVIYAGQKEFFQAEEQFQKALEYRNDPLSHLYCVHQAIARQQPDSGAIQLKKALKLFPGDEQLEAMFAYILSLDEQRDVLFSLFRQYIPELVEAEEIPAVTFRLKSPFDVEFHKVFADNGEFLEIETGYRSGSWDTSIERLGTLLAENPYLPRYYRLMALLLLKKKEYKEAESHALAAMFLEPDQVNKSLLDKVQQHF